MAAGAWEELVNSDRHDYLGTGRGEDQLDDPAWREGYLKRWGLQIPGLSGTRLVRELKKLRTVLQEEAQALAGRPGPGPGSFKRLNAYLGSVPLVRVLEIDQGRPRLRLKASRREMSSILAEIAASFAETIAKGETSRLKICGNADCRWIFYDRTKNKSRKWCELTCGNLMKVRRFRRRHKKANSALKA